MHESGTKRPPQWRPYVSTQKDLTFLKAVSWSVTACKFLHTMVGRPSADVGVLALRMVGIYEGADGEILVHPDGVLAMVGGLQETAQKLKDQNALLLSERGGLRATNLRLEGDMATLRNGLLAQTESLEAERASKIQLLVVAEKGCIQLQAEHAEAVRKLQVDVDWVRSRPCTAAFDPPARHALHGCVSRVTPLFSRVACCTAAFDPPARHLGMLCV